MARRDLTGAVDFSVLEGMTGGDAAISEEVLGLFVEQAALWSVLLNPRADGWRDGVHTIRGAAAGIGAGDLAAICAQAETVEQAWRRRRWSGCATPWTPRWPTSRPIATS